MDLYRFYDHEGRLLYVGISLSVARRASQHARDKPWWTDVGRMDVEHLPDRPAALLAERVAITVEQPLHNVTHNQPQRERTPTIRHRRLHPDVAMTERIVSEITAEQREMVLSWRVILTDEEFACLTPIEMTTLTDTQIIALIEERSTNPPSRRAKAYAAALMD